MTRQARAGSSRSASSSLPLRKARTWKPSSARENVSDCRTASSSSTMITHPSGNIGVPCFGDPRLGLRQDGMPAVCVGPPRHPSQEYTLRGPLPTARGDLKGGAVADQQGEANELGQAGSPHLGHDIGPVDLDRPGADPELVRDHLVGFAFDETVEHLLLALAQRFEAHQDVDALRLVLRLALMPVEGRAHSGEQQFVVEGLLDEVDRSFLHRLDGERHIRMSGYHDHGKADAALGKAAEEFDAVDARHAHIGDDAARRRLPDVVEKLAGGFVQPDWKPVGSQQERERLPDSQIIIDNMDDGITLHEPAPPDRLRAVKR
ncbi:hypothetical protein BO1005MUT1_390055 [Hyphomicrobiales bacterium]|nr:hypothetical protein BO1005MUT1_390055 [Hyphomicrobiales bacterium]